ncbi:hypothetical protein M0657_000787 [Pyricularia oryzae]|nr:hypothetical protein M9X92_000825 [Pyricularia oryzae]KAI7932062.1 hypothetical protein M0657_000787 [Pyricularia oryzae]
MRADDVADDDSMGCVRTRMASEKNARMPHSRDGGESDPRILRAGRSNASGACLGQWRPVHEATTHQRRWRVVRKAPGRSNCRQG